MKQRERSSADYLRTVSRYERSKELEGERKVFYARIAPQNRSAAIASGGIE